MRRKKSPEGPAVFGEGVAGGLRRGGFVAAFLAAGAVFLILLQIEKNMLEDYEKTVVLVATESIPRGHALTGEDCEECLEQREIDKKLGAECTLLTAGELVGLVPRYDIEQGTILTRGMFTDKEEILGHMREPVVAGVKAEDLFQVAGGVIRAGDRIHVYSVTQESEIGHSWENLWVQSVFDQSGKEIRNPDRTGQAQRINIYLDKSQVGAFYTELAAGTLRVVKACQ